MRLLIVLCCVGVVLLCGGAAVLAAGDFQAWKSTLRHDALSNGIRSDVFDRVMADVRPIPRVLELDRKQPEKKKTFADYRRLVISDQRLREGRRKLETYPTLLGKTENQYRVPREVIVALWGVETSYGKNMGGFPVLSALATLAFDGRRSAYFRTELINALRIVQEGHIDPAAFKGSWAGAMGQCQFMPSSFLSFAVDANNDGHKNIWSTRADVFASMGNYLEKSGWRMGEPIAIRVSLPPDFDPSQATRDIRQPVSTWQVRGVRTSEIPTVSKNLVASIILPDGINGPAYMVFDNFNVLMKWNRSLYFGLAVSEIAGRIAQ